jgi:phosphoglycolate phosphatase
MLVGRFLRHHWFAKIKDCEAPPISRLAEYRRELSQLIIIRSPRKYVTESPADQRDLVRGARGRFYNALDLINRLKIHRTMQIKRAVKALLFDLGTLTDPKPGIAACIQHAMRALGHQAPHVDDLLWCIGPPLKGAFAKLLNTTDATVIDTAVALYRERFGTLGLFENAVYEDVPRTLQTLRGLGYQTFVATSKPFVYAERIVKQFALAELFDKVYGSELSGIRTDKGELIAHVLLTENLSPREVFMIGDREHDVIGAKKNGVRCIGVAYGYGTEEELRNSGALSIAGSPRQIIEIVESHHFRTL